MDTIEFSPEPSVINTSSSETETETSIIEDSDTETSMIDDSDTEDESLIESFITNMNSMLRIDVENLKTLTIEERISKIPSIIEQVEWLTIHDPYYEKEGPKIIVLLLELKAVSKLLNGEEP
jgi:hypothetical protein